MIESNLPLFNYTVIRRVNFRPLESQYISIEDGAIFTGMNKPLNEIFVNLEKFLAFNYPDDTKFISRARHLLSRERVPEWTPYIGVNKYVIENFKFELDDYDRKQMAISNNSEKSQEKIETKPDGSVDQLELELDPIQTIYGINGLSYHVK